MKQRILYFESPKISTTLQEACFCLTPMVFSSPSGSLYMDIGQTLKRLGGESKALELFGELLHTFQIEGKGVLTDRPEWAKMLVTSGTTILPEGAGPSLLSPLPMEKIALCGDPFTLTEQFQARQDLVSFMRRIGMKCLGDFMQLPLPAIDRRFGKLGNDLWEWLFGKKTLCLPLFVPLTPIQITFQTDSVHSLEGLLFSLKRSLLQLECALIGRALVAKQLRLDFKLDWGEPFSKTLTLSEPVQSAERLFRALRDFLEPIRWSSPLQELHLEVTESRPAVPGQLSLFDKVENRRHDLHLYLERLQYRYGSTNAGISELQESYLPERSWRMRSAQKTLPPTSLPNHPPAYAQSRPPFLYTPPKPCIPNRTWKLTPLESIASEWWKPGGIRKYFLANPPSGERLWVYFDSEKRQWYLQGSFE